MAPIQRWARHVHMRTGALKGWCAKCPAAKRHSALKTVARKDGYAVTVRRLNFLRNVASPRTNAELKSVAGRDLRWMEKAHRNGKASHP